MAKYSKDSGKKVEKTMHEMHEGKLKSGSSGKKVTDPKQAIAIGLSEARKEGDEVPKNEQHLNLLHLKKQRQRKQQLRRRRPRKQLQTLQNPHLKRDRPKNELGGTRGLL